MMTGQSPTGMPRLLAAAGPTLSDHHRQFGPLPNVPGAELISMLNAAGLRGRGGAGFPAGRKMASVPAKANPVVVANGAEGEPLSRKDAVLLIRAPHLVLDGLELAAAAVGAGKVYLYVPAHVTTAATSALQERRTGTRPAPTVVEAPDAFVAGEESALTRRIEGGPALPRDRTVVTAVSGVGGRPTLVNNVETLAHIALVARFGPDWFRAVGDPTDPGSMLITLSGAMAEHGVIEMPTGATVAEIIERSGPTDPTTVRAVLVGGYHGRWISASDFSATRVSGVGIIHALASDECGLERTAAIVDYLAAQSAGQCGPCRIGLPRLTQLLYELVRRRVDNTRLWEVQRVVDLVDGRGACRHPDGTARLVRSALTTFADDIDRHRHRRCEAEIATNGLRFDPPAAQVTAP
jgi:NADH:ubiquinone oxidoreductase subunit F (NADH-binding)